MKKAKSIALFALVFLATYSILLFPGFKIYESYSDAFREKANLLFGNWSEEGQVAFLEEVSSEFDTKIFIGNKQVFLSNGEPRAGMFRYSIRFRGFMTSMFVIALFSAAPVKVWKRLAFITAAFILINFVFLFNLYIMILNKYMETPELELHQYGKTKTSILHSIDLLLNTGFGFPFFAVVLIWIGLFTCFERNTLKGFKNGMVIKKQ